MSIRKTDSRKQRRILMCSWKRCGLPAAVMLVCALAASPVPAADGDLWGVGIQQFRPTEAAHNGPQPQPDADAADDGQRDVRFVVQPQTKMAALEGPPFLFVVVHAAQST